MRVSIQRRDGNARVIITARKITYMMISAEAPPIFRIDCTTKGCTAPMSIAAIYTVSLPLIVYGHLEENDQLQSIDIILIKRGNRQLHL